MLASTVIEQLDVAARNNFPRCRTRDGDGVAIHITHVDRVPFFAREASFNQAVEVVDGFAHPDSSCPAGWVCVAGG